MQEQCNAMYVETDWLLLTSSGQMVDKFTSEDGYFSTQTKKMNQRLREYLEKKYHMESILLRVKADKIQLSAGK
jgi:hypothetical protein